MGIPELFYGSRPENLLESSSVKNDYLSPKDFETNQVQRTFAKSKAELFRKPT